MPTEHHYYVYILSSRSRTLYIGLTNNLARRTFEHRSLTADTFTAQNHIHRLVHYEHFRYIKNAIAREKQLKGWLRQRKTALIEATNPTWQDLFPELTSPSPNGCLPEQSEGPASRPIRPAPPPHPPLSS